MIRTANKTNFYHQTDIVYFSTSGNVSCRVLMGWLEVGGLLLVEFPIVVDRHIDSER